jgi:spermidine synthase
MRAMSSNDPAAAAPGPTATIRREPAPGGGDAFDRSMWALMAAFFASGFSALLCQIVWQRMLGIFAGSDSVSAALVVGAFLAGLGIGSILGARIADRLTPAQALIGFALAETGVAAFALLSKAFLYDFLAMGLAGVVDEPAAIFALCFAGLVLPTTLMGLSLPLLSRTLATSLGNVAERVGNLYGLNTLGAGMGALLGGWILVGWLGFVGALVFAAALNLLVAAVALLLMRTLTAHPGVPATAVVHPDAGGVPDRAPQEAAGAGTAEPYGGVVSWCALVFLSGYVIVALEIVWVRVLGQIGMFHAYLFPTVLGIFLLADGLGIAVASRIVRRVIDPRPAFFLAQGGGFALAALLLLLAWWAVPSWPLVEVLAPDNDRINAAGFATMLVLTSLVVGPPAFLIGMTFPFVQRAVQQDLSRVGERVGWVQLANIAGNAAGAVVTGLVTLHLLGTSGTMRLLAALSLLLMVGWLLRQAGRRGPTLAVGLCCAVALVAAPGNQSFWSRLHLERADHRVAWAEDRSGVAFYRGQPAEGGGVEGPFFIQGFAQGRIPFLPLHQFLGAVGPLLHPDPRSLLVIGVGSGGTPWAAGVLPKTAVRAVELVGPVLDAHRELAKAWPDGPSARMLADPRWRMTYGDGRRLLARESTTYDVIEADALLPEGSLSGLLYSREFLQLARSRLAPGGLYVQWAPSCRIVETFRAVFPHAVLLLPARVMIGSDTPIAIDADALARRFAEPAVSAHLAIGTPGSPLDVEGFVRTITVWSGSGTGEAAPLTDLRPRDEFSRNNPRVWVSGAAPAQPARGEPAVVRVVPAGGPADARSQVPGCELLVPVR